MRISLPLAACAALVILGADGLTSVALAKDPPKTYRRYDDSGRFDGTTREDEKGEFDGTIREESD